MAVTAGSGGTGTVDTTGDYIFNVTGGTEVGATSIQIWNEDSAIALNVLVAGVHESTEELSLPAGKTTIVRFGDMGIRSVFCSAASSTVEVHWGIVAKTGASM